MTASAPADVRSLLAGAPLEVHGRIFNASNNTMLVQVGDPGLDLLAVYKPAIGERPLWDFPGGSLHRREVAAGVVSDFLGWQIVPPTVLRDGPFGEGSVQLFVEHDPQRHYFVLVGEEIHDDQLARMAAFDLLTNNADRKGSHVLLDGDGHVWGCDHGLTFHPEPKVRTVIWELGGRPLDPAWVTDLGRLARTLAAPGSALERELAPLLDGREIAMLGLRAEALCREPVLPDVEEDLRPYPWPPL